MGSQGAIKKKLRKNVTLEAIKAKLMRGKRNRSGVCGYYLSFQ